MSEKDMARPEGPGSREPNQQAVSAFGFDPSRVAAGSVAGWRADCLRTRMAEFDAAYSRACASSQAHDWMEAALLAQHLRDVAYAVLTGEAPKQEPPASPADELAKRSEGAAYGAILDVVRSAWSLVDNTGYHDVLPLAINRDDWDELAARLGSLKDLLPLKELPADPPHAVTFFWPAGSAPIAPSAPRKGPGASDLIKAIHENVSAVTAADGGTWVDYEQVKEVITALLTPADRGTPA